MTSPNYPNSYNPREECDYHLKIPSAYSIRLVVEFFETENLKDVLAIGPGPTATPDPDPSVNDTAVVELSGKLVNPNSENSTNLTYIFDTNQVWLHWFSNRTKFEKGFLISWDSSEFFYL